MTVAEKIIERVRHLPEPVQVQVLDFVEYLESKAESEDRSVWSGFSLSQALRDMEPEPSSYSENDLKEVFA
jgi:hypothetical protein